MKEESVKEYTLTIFCENQTGLLARIVGIITRRHFDMISVSASPSSMEGIYRFTIVLPLTHEQVRKVALQIEKQVDVLKVFYYENHEIIHQEIALYKIPSNVFYQGERVEQLIRRHNARVLMIEQEYIVIEKTGHREEIDALLSEFKKIGIYEFVRSGKIAIVKEMEKLKQYLSTLKE
ncbi:MAG: acetolactate synthase small subunit [Saprospiraceae bacterium]|nr:acetolactate synthase small subunit [Saprospiraceae bacterium]